MIAKLIQAKLKPRPAFQQTAMTYFRDQVGPGMLQRIDGIACFSPLSDYWFWRFRLNRRVARGELTRRAMGSFWRSCDGMPAYGLPSQKGSTT